jgi:hypothetical protein
LLDEDREPCTLECSLDRRASASEDSDIVNQVLRAYDGDIQVAVSVIGSDADASHGLA